MRIGSRLAIHHTKLFLKYLYQLKKKLERESITPLCLN